MRPITEEEREWIWDLHQAGVPVKRIARMMGRQNCSMRELISRTGGIRPEARVVNDRHLGLAERTLDVGASTEWRLRACSSPCSLWRPTSSRSGGSWRRGRQEA